MRSSFLLLLFCIASFTWAQAPERMSFQAVVRDAGDMLVTNSNVTLRMSILQGSANGTPVFVETHSATTNANGLVTVELGSGTVVSGSVGSIDWSSGPYFLRTETDPLGGSNYSIAGTSELLSVPYALHAANNMQGPAGPQGPPGVAGCDMVRSGNMVVVYTPTHAYGFYQSQMSGSLNTGNWSVTTLSGDMIGAIASENTIVVYTSTHAYGLYQSQMSGSLNTANWTVTTLEGNVIDAVSNKNQIAVYTSSHAYGFYQAESSQNLNNGNWSVATLDGIPMGAVPSRQQIVVYTTTHAYGFYQAQSSQSLNNGNWAVTSLDGTPAGALPTR